MMDGMPYLAGLGLNGHVIAFAAVIAVLAAMLFSIVPALRLSRDDLRGAWLKVAALPPEHFGGTSAPNLWLWN